MVLVAEENNCINMHTIRVLQSAADPSLPADSISLFRTALSMVIHAKNDQYTQPPIVNRTLAYLPIHEDYTASFIQALVTLLAHPILKSAIEKLISIPAFTATWQNAMLSRIVSPSRVFVSLRLYL